MTRLKGFMDEHGWLLWTIGFPIVLFLASWLGVYALQHL